MLGAQCLTKIEGEIGVALHNNMITMIKAVVSEEFLGDMFVGIAEAVLKYAELTNVKRGNNG